jgi:diadenosine tetraphosphatase ApaH/serine/threonine PP2A family protein phosphatase
MCKYCRHGDISPALDQIRKDFDLDTVFGGNMKACLKACQEQVRILKSERHMINQRKESTYLIDAKIGAFSWACWVLQRSREDLKEGRRPWLNGYRGKPHGGPQVLFM